MSTKVNLYSSLQNYTGSQPVVEVEGSTVGECLEDLCRKYPLLKPELLDQTGALLPYVYVSINLSSPKSEQLTTPVNENDELFLILIIAGG